MSKAAMKARPKPDAVVCRRDRCRRTLQLDENQLCPVHRCPTPFCTGNKSNKAEVCDKCVAARDEPLPKDWSVAKLGDGITAFLNNKLQVAQFEHPGPKGEHTRQRSTAKPPIRVSKGMPTIFTIEPQESDLGDNWEHVIVAAKGKNSTIISAVMIFRNTTDGGLQQADPRDTQDVENALPDGWSKRYDDDGDEFFYDHNNNIATYDDPREVVDPRPSPSLEKYTIKRRRSFAQMSVRSKAKWFISKLDEAAFSAIDNNLVKVDKIPPCVRNKKHNRYLDILPNPETRVPLAQIGDSEESAYINANFVSSFSGREKAYIASMGPLPACVGNFWRMIWEHNVTNVLMLTSLVEKGKRKCERYWPPDEQEGLDFDGISVQLTGTEYGKGYQVHNLVAQKGSETRKLRHFWFYAWPDHGVPKDNSGVIYPDDLLEMVLTLRKQRKKDRGPLLVHCSAGIGRTGTVIAIEHAIDSLEQQSKCDLITIIKNLRQFRCAMVQHPVQYVFTHEAAKAFAATKKVKFNVEGETDVVDGAAADGAGLDAIAEDDESLEAQRKKEKSEAKQRLQRQRTTKKMRPAVMTASEVSGELRRGSVSASAATNSSFEAVWAALDTDNDGFISRRDARLQGISQHDFDTMAGGSSASEAKVSKEQFKAWYDQQDAL